MGKPSSPYRISIAGSSPLLRDLGKKAIVGSAETEKLLYVSLEKILPLIYSVA